MSNGKQCFDGNLRRQEMKQDARSQNTVLEPTFHDTSLDNTRLYSNLLMSLNLASNVSVYVKRKGNSNELDRMEVVVVVFLEKMEFSL